MKLMNIIKESDNNISFLNIKDKIFDKAVKEFISEITKLLKSNGFSNVNFVHLSYNYDFGDDYIDCIYKGEKLKLFLSISGNSVYIDKKIPIVGGTKYTTINTLVKAIEKKINQRT